MLGSKALPQEILAGIVSHLSKPGDLFNCILASRDLGEVAKAALYSNIDLTFDNDNDPYDEEENSDVEQQKKLLSALAQNSQLGSLVRKFANCKSRNSDGLEDATLSSDTQVVIGAARNLRRLTEAYFTPNPLGTSVIDALSTYSHLSTLVIDGISPEEHIWSKGPTSLVTLTWNIPHPTKRTGRLSTQVDIVLNAVESTCPQLKDLDLKLTGFYSPSPTPDVKDERLQQYADTTVPPTILAHLQHFSLDSSSRSAESKFLEIIERYCGTLKSVSIPRGDQGFILKVCKLLPGLRAIDLNQRIPNDLLQILTTNLASCHLSIERFSLRCIDCPFSAEIGNIFQEWKDLRFLHLGDYHWEEGEGFFRNDGRPDFENYDILGFIRQLPQSLEELYLEINAEGVCCDEDEDFDPFCSLGPQIFRSLKRLHTCDLHAWISNLDGGLGQIPEKSVHYRRLPHKNDPKEEPNSTRKKDVWTSRMDCVYQEDFVNVSKRCDVVELDVEEGEFCGEDAKEVWLNGFTSRDPSDYSWPSYYDPVQAYSMYRKT